LCSTPSPRMAIMERRRGTRKKGHLHRRVGEGKRNGKAKHLQKANNKKKERMQIEMVDPKKNRKKPGATASPGH